MSDIELFRQGDVKIQSRMSILYSIYKSSHHGISQSGVAADTGLPAPTVFRNFTALEKLGLIEPAKDAKIHERTKGRRPSLYCLKGSAVYTISAELSFKTLNIGIYDLLIDTVEKVFPKTITQRCIVHIVRNIHSVCNKKDAKDIIKDFKKIYTSSTLNEAKEEYTNFKEKYTNKVAVMKKVENNLNWIYQLFEYPPNIRRLMYTTNAIESVNAALRKVTKGKGTFVNEEALMKVLYLRIKDLEKKWNKGTKDWINVQNEFTSVYKEEYTKYLDLI